MALTSVWRGSGFCAAEGLFYFAPHFFDGVEVWAVGGKEEGAGSGLLDQGKGEGIFVRQEIVHDDDVSGAQGRAQDVADGEAAGGVADFVEAVDEEEGVCFSSRSPMRAAM